MLVWGRVGDVAFWGCREGRGSGSELDSVVLPAPPGSFALSDLISRHSLRWEGLAAAAMCTGLGTRPVIGAFAYVPI